MTNFNENKAYSIKEKDGQSFLLSVIVPVYNVEAYLDKCLQSILNQTYTNLEVILVNDGSTDSSGLICDQYKGKDSRIKVFHQENQGLSAARNTGLRNASGSFVSFIDSDDWIELDMYTIMISFLTQNNLKIVECDVITSLEKRDPFTSDVKQIIESNTVCLNRIIKNEKFSVCRRIYERKLLEGHFFIPQKIYEDLFFTITLMKRVDEIGYIKYPFYTYFRERSNSIMRSGYSKKKLNSIDAGMFLINNTSGYDNNIKKSAINFFVRFLSTHYNHLFESPEFDEDVKHRKAIRKTITEYYDKSDNSLSIFIIKILPIWLYKWVFKINRARINLQLLISRS